MWGNDKILLLDCLLLDFALQEIMSIFFSFCLQVYDSSLRSMGAEMDICSIQ